MIQYRKKITAVAVTVIATAVFVIYRLFDPAQHSFFPRCPSKLITGLDCPGCGTQRALHAALNGDFAAAFHHNAILFLAIPFLILYVTSSLFKTHLPRLYNATHSTLATILSLIILIAWWIIRNIFPYTF